MNQTKLSKQELAQFRKVLEEAFHETLDNGIGSQLERIERKTTELLDILTTNFAPLRPSSFLLQYLLHL